MLRWSAFGALIGAMAHASLAFGQGFSFVAIGDMPYKVPDDYPRFERLISAINQLTPSFTFHVGDITSGTTPCSDEAFQDVARYFATFDQPLVYTPGDNEWADCHRPSAGRFDPLERLGKIREIFFPDGMSWGKRKIIYSQQSGEPTFGKFVENASFAINGVHFATLHIIGSNNNLQRTRKAMEEYTERNFANIAWTKKAFADATLTSAKALVLAMQADPMFDELVPDRRSGFNEWLDVLKAETIAFGRPVLLVHGDGHRFRIDMPMWADLNRTRLVRNFIRLEVFGETEVDGVVVTIDPSAAMPFQFRPLLVPDDRAQSARHVEDLDPRDDVVSRRLRR